MGAGGLAVPVRLGELGVGVMAHIVTATPRRDTLREGLMERCGHDFERTASGWQGQLEIHGSDTVLRQ